MYIVTIYKFLCSFKKTSSLLAFILLFSSCKKFVSVDPPIDKLNSKLVFDKDNTAIAVLNGMYSDMINNTRNVFNRQATFSLGLSADELTNYNGGEQYLNNTLTAADDGPRNEFWNPLYKTIYTANACIEGATNSQALSPATKRTVVAEAKLVRAFCHLMLASVFGSVPLIQTTDHALTSVSGKATIPEIYQAVIRDLANAKDSLSAEYPNSERTRPNKYAASALLARAYLYNGQWENADRESSSVIAQSLYSVAATPLAKVFLKESGETIWQLKPLRNTPEATDIIPSTALAPPTYLASTYLQSAFEQGDGRKTSWLKSRTFQGQEYIYPFKYKARADAGIAQTEYYIFLRLAEQFLIRAECRVRQNKISEAIDDLNVIRRRAGLIELAYALSTSQVLLAIEQERRIELFAEWGHRWIDLKRTGRITAVLNQIKPNWSAFRATWPIPLSEIILNQNLLPQNEGY